jgi:hypothetical protein
MEDYGLYRLRRPNQTMKMLGLLLCENTTHCARSECKNTIFLGIYILEKCLNPSKITMSVKKSKLRL